MAMARSLLKLRYTVEMLLNRFNRNVTVISDLLSGKCGLIFDPALAVAGPRVLGPRVLEPGKDLGGQENGQSLKDIFDGFLWAVPKHRRSIQRNRTRRRAPEKRVSYNTSLVPCETCGNLRQTGFLCGHCLVRIREETKEIQDKMFGDLDKEGALPDRENVVLYEGETLAEADKNKHPVELKKKRPSWFSRDLTGYGGKL